MHSVALGATGYTLLLSSFVTLLILLRRGWRDKKKSPFYTLSVSDLLSATLTAIVLVMNHIEAGLRLSYNWRNNTGVAPNRTWTIGDELPFPPIYDLLERAEDEANFLNVTLTCDMKDIFMQYGMLLAALTNAFVSLLTFAVQCNLNAACAKRRCASIMKSSGSNARIGAKDAKVACREGGASGGEQESAFPSRNIKSRSFIRRIVKTSRSRTAREDDRRPVGLLVASHWLVPLLVVGILYLAEYSDMSDVRRAEDAECVVDSNFPMSDFHMFPEGYPKIISSITSLENNYLNEGSSSKSSVEIDRVVSNVRSIVKAALDRACNSTEGASLPDNSGSQATSYIAGNTSNATERPNGALAEREINAYNSSASDNSAWEVSLLRDPRKNASEESDAAADGRPNEDAPRRKDAPMYLAEQTDSARTGEAIVRNGASISNNQIHSEIIKRIQAAKRNDLRDRKRKPNSMKDPFPGSLDAGGNPLHVINECLVSTGFLKLHLLALSFLIYFLPILLSSILQMRGKHVCKCALATLKARADPAPKAELTSKADPPLKTNVITIAPLRGDEGSSEAALFNEAHSESRPSTGGTSREEKLSEGSNAPPKPRRQGTDHGGRTDAEAMRKDQGYEEVQDESILLELDCMVRILNTVRLSLILCVVFWTPVFLGTLLKVFSCTRAPQWLTDATFLSAVSFGVARNVLNMNIIKIQEICSDAGKRENRIRPIK